jgi:putative ABC transport system permease protein
MRPGERRTPRVPGRDAREQAREDVDSELEFHLDRLIESNVRRGMDEATARAEALKRFGDPARARAGLGARAVARERRLRHTRHIDELRQDVRQAVRSQARSPVFALAAIATLAIGIGANTAIFGVAHGILFEPLPYAEPDRLALLWQDNTLEGDARYPFSPANYRDLVDRTRTLAAVAVYQPSSEVTVAIDGTAERVRSTVVSTEFFDVVGVQPALGRTFRPDEGVAGGPPVAVISDAYWRSRFAADPAVLGRSVELFGNPLTIVGVMPRGFTVPTSDAVDIVSAIRYAPESWTVRARHSMRVIARLREGATLEGARREANDLFAELERLHPATNRGMRVTLLDLRTALVGDVRTTLLILLGAAAVVLLVACANITNLLLARASERMREFSIRAALGAGRGRLIRQVLAESAVLALAGGAAGLVLARFIIGAVRTLGAASLPMLNRVDLSGPVLTFALAITLATVLLVGLLPALQGVRARATALRDEMRGSSAGRVRLRTRRVLVVAQVAMSLILLVGATLLIRSYRATLAVDPGFTTDRVLTFSLTKMGDAAERVRFFEEVERQLAVLPGVDGVGAVSMLPLTGAGGRRRRTSSASAGGTGSRRR